jgi:hypothetical protein
VAQAQPVAAAPTLAAAPPPAAPAQKPAIAIPAAPVESEPAAAKPAVSAEAANSLARGEDIAPDPVRPFTSGAKPARSMSMPGKFVTTEPGGWPPVVSVPIPHAGGVGVSSERSGRMPALDGRFE